MWIGDLEVPQGVLDAAEAGNLVFFVGAGTSRASPSSLPDFEQLVRNIGALVGREPTEDEVRNPDVFLGSLQGSGIDTHRLVANAIDKQDSSPNRLHRAIAHLAAAYPSPRIVTTNYDRHLVSSATELALELDIYEAPALPVGDDFEGIVHLHGSLSQPSRRLVVTDADFGRAYLRQAWAARFLERMFSTFTVVFIGYSHGDVVMQYLARSLGSDHRRYVFTDDPDNAQWRRLGLTAIPYPNESGDHSALPASLERWHELATMGPVAHRARIAALLSTEPPTIPEDVSYLEAALSHPERVRYFVEKKDFDDADQALRWFAWIEGRQAFLALYTPGLASEPSSPLLMSWIAERYILSEERSGTVLRSFREKSWPPDTWFTITRALYTRRGPFPGWLGPWLQLVLLNAPTRRHPLLDRMLAHNDWSTNFDLALMVFEDRTRPVLKPAFDFVGSGGQARFEVDLAGDARGLTDGWTRVFQPVLDRLFAEVLSLASAQIAKVYRVHRGLGPEGAFDPFSFSRSAIEPHEQDSHRKPFDALIDAARDSIEVALSCDQPVAEAYLEIWRSSPNAILRRLAVHGWRLRADIGPDEKLTWLLGQQLLWEWPLQHEVFLLIRDSLSDASDEVAGRLVAAAVAGPPGEPADEYSAYRSYNLLGWLVSAAPESQLAATAFEHAQAMHPDYQPRPHPDLEYVIVTGTVEDALPYSADQLHELVDQSPTAALSRLREFDPADRPLRGPTWVGALHSLQACVKKYPTDGVRIAALLQDPDVDIRASLIRAWGSATLDEAMVEKILTIISSWDPEEVRRTIASMLSAGGTSDHPTAWHAHEASRRLAADLWPPATAEDAAVDSESSLLDEAISRPAGHLAEFWVKVVQWEWSENESTWDGLPAQLAAQLDRMITAANRDGLLALVMLTAHIDFFLAADREWCHDRLLPRFDWQVNRAGAAVAWQGFLARGRLTERLLQAGFLDGYLATTEHAHDLPDEARSQLAVHLASITLYAPVAPTTWLRRFVAGAPEALRVSWAERIGSDLQELDGDDVQLQWDRWIRAYWTDRSESVPLPFTRAEASTTAEWVLGLPGVRDHAIDLALRSNAGLDEHADPLLRLTHLDLTTEAQDWARFLTHLLKNTSEPPWGLDSDLQKIVAQLRQGNPRPDLTGLVNEAMRLGVTKAADW